MVLFLSLWLALQTNAAPFKPRDEFSIKIDIHYRFQSLREENSSTLVRTDEISPRDHTRLPYARHPYVKLKLTMIKLSDQEMRVRITDAQNLNVHNKKLKKDGVITLDVGFPQVLKERRANLIYECMLMTDKKVPVSRIHILIDKDGNYFVNDVFLGKF